MPVILAILGAIGAALIYYIRTRGPIDSGRDLIEAAHDVRLAARRFGFKRNASRHPAEDIDDPKVAIGGIAVAFLEMDDLPANVEVHVLPTGDSKSFKDLSQYRGGQSDRAARRIDCSYAASAAYLDGVESSQ